MSNDRIRNNGIYGLTETQINLSDSICKIMKSLSFLKINLKTMHVNCDISVFEKCDANGVSMFSFSKHDFLDRLFLY